MRFPKPQQSRRFSAAFAMRPGLPASLFGAGELARIRAVADIDGTVSITEVTGSRPARDCGTGAYRAPVRRCR
jgi:hypothetical protein